MSQNMYCKDNFFYIVIYILSKCQGFPLRLLLLLCIYNLFTSNKHTSRM